MVHLPPYAYHIMTPLERPASEVQPAPNAPPYTLSGCVQKGKPVRSKSTYFAAGNSVNLQLHYSPITLSGMSSS
jgi:hypothetical protein